MMDATTDHLVEYACGLRDEDLPPDVVHQVKRTLVDTLGCAVGARDAEPVAIAARAASRVQVSVGEIASVHVATYGEAVRRTAKEPEKWDPRTRETADHSMPYLVAASFHDGHVTPATFAPARIQDPALRPLIGKLTVVEEPEFTRRYPAESCTRVELTTVDGRRLTAETAYPKGHHRNPLTDAEVEAKFRGLTPWALDAPRGDRVLAAAWNLESAPTLDGLFESLVGSATS
jgi:2-methylcitrate dehydratase